MLRKLDFLLAAPGSGCGDSVAVQPEPIPGRC